MRLILDRSSLRVENGLPCFQIPDLESLGWIQHAFLTRLGGASAPPYDSLNMGTANGDREEDVLQNRNRIASTFGFALRDLILPKQIHHDHVFVLKDKRSVLPSVLEFDALITNIPNIVLGIRTADCLPILLVDVQKKVIAAIHGGRQGTGLQITAKVLNILRNDFVCSPGNLLAVLGPRIGSCCYEIDEKVFMRGWEPFSNPKGNGRWNLDLAAINIAQMQAAGIEREQIFQIDLCTRCHDDLFFSYRRDGKTGTQLSFIGMI